MGDGNAAAYRMCQTCDQDFTGAMRIGLANAMWKLTRDLPEENFLKISKPGWKVTKCDDCAQANMRKYGRGVNKDPNKVGSSDE